MIELAEPPPTTDLEDKNDLLELNPDPEFAATEPGDPTQEADLALNESLDSPAGVVPVRKPAAESKSLKGESTDTSSGGFDPDLDVDGADSSSLMEVETINSLDSTSHAITGQAGFFRSTNKTSSASSNFSVMGVRYAYTVGRSLLMNQNRSQDSLALEGGAFMFRLVNYEVVGDSYSVLPIIVTLRYNMYFSETIGMHLYGGVARSSVIGATNGSSTVISDLQSIGPAVGGGLQFKIGPHWSARLDAGLDLVGAGLMISF
jgi:hypothetical protein